MSNLEKFAVEQLNWVGLFDKGSDYCGEIALAVMELIEVFAKQGHSGFSAALVVQHFSRLARFRPIAKVQPPLQSGHYIRCETGSLQSTDYPSLFSDDDGKTWHDIDAKRTLVERLLRRKWHTVKFPYWPE